MSWGFQNYPVDSHKQNCQFTQDEQSFYLLCYTQLDPQNQGTINGKDSVLFFKRSGIPVDVLKQVWIISSTNSTTLDRDEFFTALRLISYAQNGIEVSLSSITQNIQSPLPKFSGFENVQQHQAPQSQQPLSLQVPRQQSLGSQIVNNQHQIVNNQNQITSSQQQSRYDLHEDMLAKYSTYYSSIDQGGRGYVTGIEAKNLFFKSQLGNDVLKLIWALCDKGNKGFLHQGEFIIAIHLIALSKKGIEMPLALSENLQNVMRLFKEPSNYPSPVQQSSEIASSPSMDKFQYPEITRQRNVTQPTLTASSNISSSIAYSETETIDLQNTIQGLQSKVSELQQKIRQQEHNNSWAGAADLLKNQVDQKRKEVEFLISVLRTMEKFNLDSKNEFEMLNTQLQNLEGQEHSTMSRIKQLEQQLLDQQNSNQQLRMQLTTATTNIRSQSQTQLDTFVQPQTHQSFKFNENDDDEFADYRAKKSRIQSSNNNPVQQQEELPW